MMKMVKRHGFLFVEAPANRSGAVVVADAPRGALELAGFLGTSVERIMDVSERRGQIEDEQELAAQMQSGECRMQIGGHRILTTERTEDTENFGDEALEGNREMQNAEGKMQIAGGDGVARAGVVGRKGARRRGVRVRRLGGRRLGAAARREKYDPAVWGTLAFLSDEEPKRERTEGRGLRTECDGARSAKVGKGSSESWVLSPEFHAKNAKEAKLLAFPASGNADVSKVEEIQGRVCLLFGISKGQLLGETGTRKGRAFAGRVASMALCRAHTRLTLGEIGRLHERCEHGAVSRATRRAAELREADGKFARLYAEVEAGLLAMAA